MDSFRTAPTVPAPQLTRWSLATWTLEFGVRLGRVFG